MRYVDQDGVILKMDGTKAFDSFLGDGPSFPAIPPPTHLKCQFDFMTKYPVILQAMSRYFDLICPIEVSTISLTEKNKGQEFHSSSFTVTTKTPEFVEDLPEGNMLNSLVDFMRGNNFTLKHAPFWIIFQMFHFVEDAPAIDPAAEENARFMDMLKEDHWLLDLVHNVDNGTNFLITYKPFKVKAAITPMSTIDVGKYQTFVTKWIEVDCNRTIYTNPDLIQREMNNIENGYVWWLLNYTINNFGVEFVVI